MAVSSLLKSAEATRKKVRQQQQAEVTYQYSQSAKTYDDFLAYTKYLDSVSTGVKDPSELLSITKAKNSAQSGYISNEIQRQTFAVMSGRGTNVDKYGRMVDLYYQAADSGNLDLAQSLQNQLGSLSIQIQNEYEAGQRAAQTMALNQVTTLGKLIRKFKEGDQILRLPDGTLVKPIAVLNKEIASQGKAVSTGDELGYFEELLHTGQVMQKVVADAYMGATTQEAVDTIEQRYGDIIQGTAGLVKAAGKGDSLTLQDLSLAYSSALAGNPLYSLTVGRDEATGATSYSLVKNKVDDFIWAYNADGSVSAVETRVKAANPKEALNATLTSDGKLVTQGQEGYDQNNTIKNQLANQGYSVGETNSDGTFSIVDPEGTIYNQAVIMPDGTVRFFGQPGQFSDGQAGLYELNIQNGQKREVSYDETSMFGTQGVFGLVSQPTKEGINISKSLAGVTPAYKKILGGELPISRETDYLGRSVPVLGGNLQGGVSPLLSNAESTRTVRSTQEAAQLLQQARNFNLNQTPVQQTAQSGAPIRQLQVLPIAPTPSIKVAPPTPTPNVVVAPAKPVLGGTTAAPQIQGGTGTQTAVPRVKQPWEY